MSTTTHRGPWRRRKQALPLVVAAAALGLAPPRPPQPEVQLSKYERRVFSQNGEDGVIEKVFEIIEPTSRFCVEFGAGDGVHMSNMRNLIVNHGWRSLMIEGDPELARRCQETYQGTPGARCLQHWVYPGNVEFLFEENGVPQDLDFLVIDIDSFDYYVWKVIHEYRPKLVMIEVNEIFAPPVKAIVEYNPFMYGDNTFYHGASLQSMYELGKRKGYELVYVQKQGFNAFFVDRNYYPRFGMQDNSPARLYPPRNPNFTITADQLGRYVDEEGHIRPGLPNRYYSDAPIRRDAVTVEKRWILGR